MNKKLKRVIRKVKYALYYGIRPKLVEIHSEGVNFLLKIFPLQNGGIDIVIHNEKTWEPHISQLLKKHLQSGDTFVDVGANIGYHSIFVAKMLNDNCTVHAFEPQNHLCAQMQTSIAENDIKSVEIHSHGLSYTNGSEKFVVYDENIGSSSLLGDRNINPLSISDSYQIELVRLDDVIELDEAVKVIKIDVEGFEYDVLRGASAVIKRCMPVVIMEFSPELYEQRDADMADDIIQYFLKRNYSIKNVKDGRSIATTSDVSEQTDIICIPRNTN